MDTNNKINCNVKLYFNRKKNLHFYRYPLKAAVTGDFTTDKAALETA